jgi:signal transduction histidine kinase/FixJ family two-component response regulator
MAASTDRSGLRSEPVPPEGAAARSEPSLAPAALREVRPARPSASLLASRITDPLNVRWLVRHLPAWIGLLVVFGVVVVLSNRPAGPAIRDLAAAWPARVVLDDGTTFDATVTLPGLFHFDGVPPTARVFAVTEVVASDAPAALFVDRPQYAVTATWDGVPFGSVGDPARVGPDARTTEPLFAAIPPSEPGTRHKLGLEIRGDYGKGGIVGRILVGPVDQVHAAARATEMQRLAFALGLSLLAALPLVVAARGTWRPTYLAYGLFTSTVALHSVAQSTLIDAFLTDALRVTRLLRCLAPLTSAFGVWYGAVFVNGRLTRMDRAVIAASGTLALAGLVAPPDALYALEVLGEVLFLASAVVFSLWVVRAVARRIPGSWLFAAALLPVLWVLVSEITLTHGLRSGNTSILPTGILFAVALGAALVLRDAELGEQHERLVRGNLDAMVLVHADGRVRSANQAARDLFGSPGSGTAEVAGQFLQLVAAEDRPLARAHLTRAEGRADRADFRTVGDQVMESHATPLGPDMLLLALRDITARRELERGVVQAARVETAALLLGGIAHDFNNMLSTLLAHLGLLRTATQDPASRVRIDRMEAAVERASELTHRLLTVARGTGSELIPVDLAAVCVSAIQLVEPKLQGVVVESDFPEALPPVLGAAGDLEQVVVNLLVNAYDAVTTEPRPEATDPPTPTIRIVARSFPLGRGGRGVALMVEDNGPGIPPEKRNEVFQPFVTSKARGTGLGLAIARQILRDHHGRIWVEDRPHGGARFVLALRHADAVDEMPAPLPDGRRVVLVEDEQVLLEDYARALQQAGYEVHGFSSSAEAKRYLAEHPLDLLVTDVAMPETSGFELARLSLSLHPNAPILFVSAFIPQESLRELPEGSWHALHKPVRAARLVATVGRTRRRAERQAKGEDEITRVNYLFPNLADLTAHDLGFDEP